MSVSLFLAFLFSDHEINSTPTRTHLLSVLTPFVSRRTEEIGLQMKQVNEYLLKFCMMYDAVCSSCIQRLN